MAGFDVGEALLPRGEQRAEVVVEAIRTYPDGGRSLTVTLRTVAGEPSGARAILHGPAGGSPPHVGQRLGLFVRLRPLAGADNPGEVNHADRRWRDGIGYTGSFDPARVVALSAPSSARLWLEGQHAALQTATRQVAPDEPSAALFLTLAAGLRAELSPALEDAFARSGLAHVLSVSGLHVAVLAMLLLLAARALLVRCWAGARLVDARRLAAPLCAPLVWAYVAYTGWQPPAVRSAAMATLVLLALAIARRADALNALCWAAIAIVVCWPAAVADLSLQLSFLAVLSLILLAPAIRQLLPLPGSSAGAPAWRRWLTWAAELSVTTACASVAVILASLPLVLHVFGRVSVAGVVSNVVSLPVASALTGLAACGAAVFAVSPPLATPLLWLGTRLSALFAFIAERFAEVPGASVELPPMDGIATAAWVVGLLAFALARGRRRGLGLLAPAALAWTLWGAAPTGDGLTVTFLAVGHGDAIVLSSRGAHALVDGGGVPGGADIGARVVRPFLRQARIHELDYAVLSHPHPDHALGLTSTLARVPAREVLVPRGAGDGPLLQDLKKAAAGARWREVGAGTPSFRLGEARIEVLGPPEDALLLEGVNDRSTVLKVTHGAVSILLTGDIEEAAEELLDPGVVTVMKAPHHGSRTSSTEALLARARPKVVVFCVGRENRFGFPHPEVWDRYVAAGSECYRTDVDGAVSVRSDGRDVRVTTWRAGERLPAHADRGHVAARRPRPQP